MLMVFFVVLCLRPHSLLLNRAVQPCKLQHSLFLFCCSAFLLGNCATAACAGVRLARQVVRGDQPEGHRPHVPGPAGQGGHPGAAVRALLCASYKYYLFCNRGLRVQSEGHRPALKAAGCCAGPPSPNHTQTPLPPHPTPPHTATLHAHVPCRRAKRRNMERLQLACGGYVINSGEPISALIITVFYPSLTCLDPLMTAPRLCAGPCTAPASQLHPSACFRCKES